MKKRRVLLVDDHPIVRHGLAQLIDQEADLVVSAEVGSATQAMRVIGESRPDIAVVDISLQTTNGIELTKAIKKMDPELPVLILSMHDEALYAERALRAGANGYVTKLEAAETVLDGIRKILDGEMYVNQAIAARMLQELVGGQGDQKRFGVERLSDRELEVFDLIGRGLSTRDIAAQLTLSVKTIETHRGHIKQKLRLRNASELARHAIRWAESNSEG